MFKSEFLTDVTCGDQSEFVRRGLAAIARSEADGDWIPAEKVIAKLEAKVAAARERQKKYHQ